MSAYKKPVPVPDHVSAPYWAGCARHELLLQCCDACGTVQFYPRPICLSCMSEQLTWKKANGKGTIHTFSTIRQNRSPGFIEDVPYVLAVVTLDEGPNMTTNIVQCAPEDVRIGLPVEVVFEDISDGISLPKFRPAS